VDISEAMSAAMDAVDYHAPAQPVEEPEVEEQVAPAIVAPEGEAVVEAESVEGDEVEDAVEDPPEPTLPAGVVVAPVIEGDLATQFKIMDKEGEIEVPDLLIEYKANGQVRKDRLDQVVKLAQWGVYNEEREQKSKQVEQEYTQAKQAIEEYEQLIAEREQQMERLLQDDDFLFTVREAYERENSPERRAERAESDLQSFRVQKEMEAISEKGAVFLEQEVQPALGMILKALPSVTSEELEERFYYAMQAHMEKAPNGQPYIPMSRYDAVRRYLIEDLAVWAQIQNARRAQPTTEKKAASDDLTKARIEAQRAKRQLGTATRPVGRTAGSGAPAKQSKPATVDDALESAMSTVLSAISR
jgi:hypothetical protein